MSRSRWSERIALITSLPSRVGIIKSTIARSGVVSSRRASASCPVRADTTVKPASLRMNSRTSSTPNSSSTIRIVLPAGPDFLLFSIRCNSSLFFLSHLGSGFPGSAQQNRFGARGVFGEFKSACSEMEFPEIGVERAVTHFDYRKQPVQARARFDKANQDVIVGHVGHSLQR